MTISDTIQRDIVIAAPIDKVWDVVSVPGWWINAGEAIDLTVGSDLGVHMTGDGEAKERERDVRSNAARCGAHGSVTKGARNWRADSVSSR